MPSQCDHSAVLQGSTMEHKYMRVSQPPRQVLFHNIKPCTDGSY